MSTRGGKREADVMAAENAQKAKDRREYRSANAQVVFYCLLAMFGVAVADATFLMDGIIWFVGLIANFINYLFENSPWTPEEARSATKTIFYGVFIVAFVLGVHSNRQNNRGG